MSPDQPLAGKRIGLVTAWASRLGGGVFEAVAAQAQLIAGLGGRVHVFALEDRFSAADRDRLAGAAVQTFAVRGPVQIGYAPDLADALDAAELDCLHLHGIWMYPSRAASRWAKRSGKGYIVSPHGMLDPWILARGRWKKALARTGYERESWRRASFLHALSGAEAAGIALATGRPDTVVVPNAAPPLAVSRLAPRAPHVVYVGRIHPKKNLFALLEAWRSLSHGDGAWLTLAGWGEPDDVAALRRAAGSAGPSVRFVGPVYGAEKAKLLESASFGVLPSLSEGLPMAMLECWAAGVPTIMTEACHLPEGFAAGAALQCGTGADAIAPALAQALATEGAAWLGMAEAARGLAAGPFSVSTIAARWAAAYSHAMTQGTRP